MTLATSESAGSATKAEPQLPAILRQLWRRSTPVLKRLGDLAVLLFALTTLLFFLLRAAGDPALVLAGADADPAQIEAIRKEYGLDRPLILQYFSYMGQILQLDLGESLASGQPAMGEVLAHLPATLVMALLAITFTGLVSVFLGAWLGFNPDAPSRRSTGWVVFFMQGVPGFVVGLILIQIVAVQFQLLPSIGHGIDVSWRFGGDFPFIHMDGSIDLRHWILPPISLSFFLIPQLTRVVAANVAEAMREDYIRTARANGASRGELLWRHALPNAMLAATALIGTQFAFLLSGTVITEQLFSWPGIGWLLLKSVLTLDFPVVQAIAMVVALMVFTVNMVTELMFRVLDPRLRKQRA